MPKHSDIQSETVELTSSYDWVAKFTSRKFLFSLAAFLMSLGTGITGLAQGDAQLATAGGILCVVASAVYSACEAYVDGSRETANGSVNYIPQDVDDVMDL